MHVEQQRKEMTAHQAGNFAISIQMRRQSCDINEAKWHTEYLPSLSLLYNRFIACNLTAKLMHMRHAHV